MQSVTSSLLSHYPDLLHAFSTKAKGFSIKPFSQNNLAYHVNDDPQTVRKNHLNYSKYLDYDINRLVHMNQVHGDKIRIIDKDSDLSLVTECDALITQEKKIPLMVMVADCIPVLMYDPINKVIAVVHAGRAGVFNKIIPKTIKTMQKHFNSEPVNIITVLGPSIHPCCYQVGQEIYKEAKRLAYDYAIRIQDESYYLDLIAIVKEQLKEVKVKKQNIEISKYCTSCNHELFFSYRAEQNNTGRFSGLLMLK